MSNMLDLHPPVTQVKIGTARSITLFEGITDNVLFEKYTDESLLPFFIKSLGHTDAFVIGCYNNYYGFFVDQNDTNGKVYTFHTLMNDSSLIVVADTRAAFHEIVLHLQKSWAPFETTEYLQQTAETRHIAQTFLQFCRKTAPGSEAEFWELLAFSELGIKLL